MKYKKKLAENDEKRCGGNVEFNKRSYGNFSLKIYSIRLKAFAEAFQKTYYAAKNSQTSFRGSVSTSFRNAVWTENSFFELMIVSRRDVNLQIKQIKNVTS